jgi:hypothetical protein
MRFTGSCACVVKMSAASVNTPSTKRCATLTTATFLLARVKMVKNIELMKKFYKGNSFRDVHFLTICNKQTVLLPLKL